MENILYQITFLLFLPLASIGQDLQEDSIKLDYSQILSYCVQTDVKPVLEIIDVDTSKLSITDKAFKLEFENRFKYKEDLSSFNSEENTSIDRLIGIFKSYWRVSLLQPEQEYDSLLKDELNKFFSIKYTTTADTLDLDSCITAFIEKQGFNSLGLGKVGRLYDLVIWKTEVDTTYIFSIKDEDISAKVVFLENFISLGWTRYATIKKSIGGWATEEALFCVKESYDIESDWFTIHYLAHEGRHFEDYKIFPNLSGYDLEYRAKLTELSLAQETIYPLLEQFIGSANYENDNQHPVANYVVMKNLSMKLFNSEFESDLEKWKAIDISVLNKTAYTLLNENTEELHNKGDDVEFYIKDFN